MANYDDKKLEALGLLAEGNSAKEVSRQLSIPYPNVLKWKPEAESIQTKEDLEIVLDLDKVVLHDLAETTRDKLDSLVEEGGDVVTGVLKRLDKLGTLQIDLQESAITILKKVNTLIDDCKTSSDIVELVEAISRLQTAFFAKGANVNVLNMPGHQASDTKINKYKSLQRTM